MKENIPDYFKCVSCKNILNNAKQVECGCRFCSKCLDALIETDLRCCPGTSNFCNQAILSRAHMDYSANKAISNIIVKCPLKCSHEDQLINMEVHLGKCPKKSLIWQTCSQYGNLNKRNDAEANDQEIQLLNDIMKLKDDKIKSIAEENDNLQQTLRLKDDNIKSMNEAMELKDKKIQSIN